MRWARLPTIVHGQAPSSSYQRRMVKPASVSITDDSTTYQEGCISPSPDGGLPGLLRRCEGLYLPGLYGRLLASATTPCRQREDCVYNACGYYHWLSVPFGLTNAPATFQRALDIILSGLRWQLCLVYCQPPKNGGCREEGGRADDRA